MKTIIQRNNSTIRSILDNLNFYYRNDEINLEQNFLEIADDYDKRVNGLTISVYHKEKFLIRFINKELGDKEMIYYPEDKMELVHREYCTEKGLNILHYLFQYKNSEVDLNKTIKELYEDKKDNTNSSFGDELNESKKNIQVNTIFFLLNWLLTKR